MIGFLTQAIIRYFGFGFLIAAMQCVGLAKEWEGIIELRDRARDEKRILLYPEGDRFCKPHRQNAVANSIVITPVLKRLCEDPRLPHLDDLIVEVTTLYQKCGLSTLNKAPYKTSVEIKRLSGFVKRRASRKEVTKDLGWGPKPRCTVLLCRSMCTSKSRVVHIILMILLDD